MACRYHPSCSSYMEEAIKSHGIIKGGYLGVKRLCRCHPFGGHGIDLVPEKVTKKEKQKGFSDARY